MCRAPSTPITMQVKTVATVAIASLVLAQDPAAAAQKEEVVQRDQKSGGGFLQSFIADFLHSLFGFNF